MNVNGSREYRHNTKLWRKETERESDDIKYKDPKKYNKPRNSLKLHHQTVKDK